MKHPVPAYAKSIVTTIRTDAAQEQRKTSPAVETAQVVTLKGGVHIQPASSEVIYDEDDILWNIDPDSLKVGDTVTMLRDQDENPIVTGLIDGMQPDPSIHPKHIKLRNQFDRLKANTMTWKPPVNTVDDLPDAGNRSGDIRLVLGNNTLYRWRAGLKVWSSLVGAGSGGAENLNDLLDVVLGTPQVGDTLFYDGTKWVNAPGTSGLVPSVSTTANLAATVNHRVILASTVANAVGISLPAVASTGVQITVKWTAGSNPLVVTPLSGTIDSGANFVFTVPKQSITFHRHGANWFVV